MNPNERQGGAFLHIVFIQGSSIFELFAGEHKLLLVRQNIFLILNFDHRISNCIIWVDFKSNSLTRKNLNRDFHNEIYQNFHELNKASPHCSTRHVHSVRVFWSCRGALALQPRAQALFCAPSCPLGKEPGIDWSRACLKESVYREGGSWSFYRSAIERMYLLRISPNCGTDWKIRIATTPTSFNELWLINNSRGIIPSADFIPKKLRTDW